MQKFLSLSLRSSSFEKKFISIYKILKNLFEELDADVIRIYMNTRDIPVRMKMNIHQDKLYLIKKMETFCADLCNLRKDDSIQYAEILSKTVNNNKIIIYNIEGKDEQQMISLSSVLRRVEDVYSTTDDSDFLPLN